MSKFGRKKEIFTGKDAELVQEKAHKEEQNLADIADQCIGKWGTHSVGANLPKMAENNLRKARRIALSMEKQNSYMKKYKEALTSSGLGNSPETVLKVLNVGGSLSNRGDIFAEVQLRSTNDPIFIIEKTYGSTLRNSTAGDVIFEKPNELYGSSNDEENLGTADGVTTAFTGTGGTLPIIAGSVQLFLTGETPVLIANDDGAGNFVAVSAYTNLAASTVNYTTGAFAVNFTVAPATGKGDVIVRYLWDTEADLDTMFPKIGDVSLKVTKHLFDPVPHPVGYNVTEMAKLRYETTGLGNLYNDIGMAAGEVHAMRKDLEAVLLAKRYAGGNTVRRYNARFADSGEYSSQSHKDNITTLFKQVDADIYNDKGRGNITHAVCGMGALNYISGHSKFDETGAQPKLAGTFYAGMLNGIKFYGTPSGTNGVLSDNQVLMNFKNEASEFDTSLIYGVLGELDAYLDYPELHRKGTLARVEDKIKNETKFVRLAEIDNLPTFA